MTKKADLSTWAAIGWGAVGAVPAALLLWLLTGSPIRAEGWPVLVVALVMLAVWGWCAADAGYSRPIAAGVGGNAWLAAAFAGEGDLDSLGSLALSTGLLAAIVGSYIAGAVAYHAVAAGQRRRERRR